MTDTSHLKSLGSNKTEYKLDEPDASILEKFEAPTWAAIGPSPNGAQAIHIEVPEFTSLCPKTGQPDFANIIIDYSPRQWCVESKSLKLYMFSFRNAGEFHEACINRIMGDFITLLDPWWIRIQGQFSARGGIPLWPQQQYEHRDLRNPNPSGLVVPK